MLLFYAQNARTSRGDRTGNRQGASTGETPLAGVRKGDGSAERVGIVNDFHNLSPTRTVSVATLMAHACGEDATPPFGLSAAQKTALQTGAAELDVANAALVSAKCAYRAAVLDRNAKRKSCVRAMASVARTLFASGATPGQIAAFGLSPHSKERTKGVPTTPASLLAQALPNGAVRLTWNRNGNPRGAMFQIEAQQGDDSWAIVGFVTACKAVVYDPKLGARTRFRVRASKCGQVSPPTPEATIYADPATFLRLAS